MEKSEAKLPLQVIFIWNPQDENEARPLAEHCFDLLSRDVQKPFSRSMNMPVYMYRSPAKGIGKESRTEHTLIFPMVSINAASDESWVRYFKDEFKSLSKGTAVVPVALDGDGISLSPVFGDVNFIRVYDANGWEENRQDWFFITVAHEIYRHIFVPKKKKKMPLNIFLSHRKEQRGKEIADALKTFIDRHTHMRDFFDVTDILPGEDFSKKIKASIPGAALLAIHTDKYSESYWCQKETLLAKKHDVPMVRLDALEKGEDRSFPLLGNVPVLRAGERLESKDILGILAGLMLETTKIIEGNTVNIHWMHCMKLHVIGIIYTLPRSLQW